MNTEKWWAKTRESNVGKIILYHGSPDEENGYLSNWYPSCFKLNETVFHLWSSL